MQINSLVIQNSLIIKPSQLSKSIKSFEKVKHVIYALIKALRYVDMYKYGKELKILLEKILTLK